MLAFALVVIGVLSRLFPHLSQFTAILAVSLFAGMYLSKRQALIVPVALMIITDAILGFHDTMFFTWGAMAAVSFIGVWLKKRKSLMTVFAGSIFSSVVFFLATNFGAWLSPLYPDTLEGLRECFIMAIPFFRSTLLSTVAYSLVLYAGYEWILKRWPGAVLCRFK